MFPGAFGFSVPADHDLVAPGELDLDPRSRSFAGLVPTASRNVDRRVDLSFTSVGSRDHELRLSQMHRRGVAA